MRIAPLIYSRTFYNDFNAKFAVRPSDLDIEWASSKILPSMQDIDILKGFRRVVAKKDDLCIAGISGFLNNLIQKFLPQAAAKAEKYLVDKESRRSIVFIGYAFKGEDGVPDVSFENLWQMFDENMQKIWNSQNSEVVYVDYISWQTKNPPKKPSGSQTIGDDDNKIEYYEINEDTEEKIFEWCLAQRIDFCSNINQYKVFQNTNYKVITASSNVINRLRTLLPQIQNNRTEIVPEKPSPIWELNQLQNISVEDFFKIIKNIQLQELSVEDFLKVLKEFSEKFIIVDERKRIRNEHEIDLVKPGYSITGNFSKITIEFQKINSVTKTKYDR